MTYDHIAGHNIERLAALSDAVFAVAMTLLILDIHVPSIETVHSEKDLWQALLALTPKAGMFAMSFLTRDFLGRAANTIKPLCKR